MPWHEESVVEPRLRFVLKVKEEGMSMTAACDAFGMSRPAGYKWLDRYESEGLEGLEDQSRAPEQIHHKTSDAVEDVICEVRREHGWGAGKIKGWLEHRYPNKEWPSSTTVGNILKRNDLIDASKRRRRKVPVDEGPLAEADAPNRIWSVDFKGEFELKDGKMCYPLTICDNYSRMLLGCYSLPSTKGKRVKK